MAILSGTLQGSNKSLYECRAVVTVVSNSTHSSCNVTVDFQIRRTGSTSWPQWYDETHQKATIKIAGTSYELSVQPWDTGEHQSYTIGTWLTMCSKTVTGIVASSVKVYCYCSVPNGVSYSSASLKDATVAESSVTTSDFIYYTVTYDRNGGSGTKPADQIKYYGVNLALRSYTGTKTGYYLAGWNTNSSGTGTNYALGGTYSGNANLTLYAKWMKNTYTLTYDWNNGVAPSGQSSTKNVTYESTYGTLPTPTRTGYTLSGWNTKRDGTGSSVTSSTTMGASNTTIYAQWTANTYTLTLYEGVTVIATYGQTMPSIVLPTKEGYIFNGYYYGDVQYYTSAGTSSRNWDRTQDTTLSARWAPITYSIQFNSNSAQATGAMAPQSATYDQPMSLSACKFVYPGFLFDGWATTSQGSVVYTDREVVSNLTTTNGAVVTLYAKWKADIYYVEFHDNYGTATIQQTLTFNTPTALRKNTFVREGYRFIGWSKQALAPIKMTDPIPEDVYADEAIVVNLAAQSITTPTVDLYAVWQLVGWLMLKTDNDTLSKTVIKIKTAPDKISQCVIWVKVYEPEDLPSGNTCWHQCGKEDS